MKKRKKVGYNISIFGVIDKYTAFNFHLLNHAIACGDLQLQPPGELRGSQGVLWDQGRCNSAPD